jgi:hypothetical protein
MIKKEINIKIININGDYGTRIHIFEVQTQYHNQLN